MAGHDSHNFSSSSSHRLPTTSATQALLDESSTLRKSISTGLRGLDVALSITGFEDSDQQDMQGGVPIGHITEVYGPPGAGKSSFALNVAANVLRKDEEVVWVDTTKPTHSSRLKNILSSETNATTFDPEMALTKFHHWTTPTLAHLLALLSPTTTDFPPPNTGLIVVDDLSTLFSLSYQYPIEQLPAHQGAGKKSQVSQWVSGRRWMLMDHLINELGRLAATKDIAILTTGQTNTRIRDDARAMLFPAMNGKAWETGLNTRIVLFKDWLPNSSEASGQGSHQSAVTFAGVTKAQKISYEDFSRITAFRITRLRLEEVPLDILVLKAHTSSLIQPTASKRRYSEVADSESDEGPNAASDHEFGWDDEETKLDAEMLSR